MNNKKSTKRTLAASVLSLILCMAMLIGTTFAWFTDSVTSENNIIKSGKLDAELKYTSTFGGEWQDASGGAIFKYDKWEPGYVDVKYVQVANVGNLAFKYLLNIIPETVVEEGKTNLADVIDVYIVKNPTTAITRDLAGTTKVGTLASLIEDSDGAARGILLPTEGSKNVTLAEEDVALAETGSVTMGIALKMQESAGNEYQELSVGGGFKVELLATQYTWENDSFDNSYDKNSKWAGEVATIEELQGALNSGGTIKLLNDISTDGTYLTIPKGVNVTINLNGKTLTNTNTMVIRNSGNLTLTGKGTIKGSMGGYAVRSDNGSLTVDEGVVFDGGFGAISLFGDTVAVINNATLSAEGKTANTCHLIFASGNSTLEINGGTYTHNTGGKIDSGHVVTSMENATVIINDGTFSGGYGGNVSEYSSTSSITIKGGTFQQDPSKYVADGYSVIKVSDNQYAVVEAESTTVISSGVNSDGAGKLYVYSVDGLEYVNDNLAGVKTIELLTDISDVKWSTVNIHQDAKGTLTEINGNGHTISNMSIDGQAMFGMVATGKTFTVKDVTFDNTSIDSGKINTSIICVQTYTDMVLDNVDVVNSSISGGYKVAALVGTVYDENKNNTITLTVKNCDVSNCTITTTSFDFMTCGMVAFVYADDNDKVVFENCTISDTTLVNTNSGGYNAHAFVYCTNSKAEECYDEAPGVTVTNCVFESK